MARLLNDLKFQAKLNNSDTRQIVFSKTSISYGETATSAIALELCMQDHSVFSPACECRSKYLVIVPYRGNDQTASGRILICKLGKA